MLEASWWLFLVASVVIIATPPAADAPAACVAFHRFFNRLGIKAIMLTELPVLRRNDRADQIG